MRELLPPRGIEAKPEEILITVGAQQGLALISDLMLGEHRHVGMENPGYLDAFQIFRDVNTTVSFINWMDGSMKSLVTGEFDALYVTPSHQHPTTKTMPFDARRQLLAAADRNDFVIIEDDFDSEIRYVGRPTPALKSMDQTGRVIYVGTFSKFVAPGLRLGFIVADREVIAALRLLRRHDIKHPSGLLQRGLALFIESGDYQRSLRTQRYLLKQKWETLITCLRRELPWALNDIPTGGISFWVQGKDDLDTSRLERLAINHGILIDAGSHFYFDSDAPRPNFRLGYNAIPLSRIDTGIHKLATLVQNLDEQSLDEQ